jgi:hypothetical protein
VPVGLLPPEIVAPSVTASPAVMGVWESWVVTVGIVGTTAFCTLLMSA